MQLHNNQTHALVEKGGEMAQSQSSSKGSKSTTKLAASPKKLLAVTTRCNKIGLIVTEKKSLEHH
jgi:hypothetical protein